MLFVSNGAGWTPHAPNLFLQNYQNCQRHKYTSTVSRLSWNPKVFIKSASGHTVSLNWHNLKQGILKGEVSLYRWPPVWPVWISLFCKNCQLSYSWFQKSQIGGQPYTDTSPFSIIPCSKGTFHVWVIFIIFLTKKKFFSVSSSLTYSSSSFLTRGRLVEQETHAKLEL